MRASRAGCSLDSGPGSELASSCSGSILLALVSVSAIYLLIRHESNRFKDHLRTQLITIAFIFFFKSL